MRGSSLKRVQKSLIIFNVIFAIISLICLLSTFACDFWTFKLGYNLNGADVKNLLEKTMPDESKSYIDLVNWDNFDAQALHLNFSVNTIDSLKSLLSDEKTIAKHLLDGQIDSLIAQARPIVDTLLKVTAEAFLKVTVRQIENAKGSSETMELTEIESVIDNYLNDTITKDSAVNQIIDITAIEIPKITGEEFSDSDRQKIKDNFEALINPIEECRGENGKLDMMSIVYDKLVESEVFSNEGDIPTGDEVLNVIRQNVYDKLESSGIVAYLSIGMKILAVLIIIQTVSWLMLFLFATIRIFSRRKATGLMVVRTFSWIPHVILVGIPCAFLILMRQINPSFLANIGLEKLSLNFSSVTSISAGGALIVSVIAIAFYSRLRRHERDYLEDEEYGTDMIYPDMQNTI